MSFIVSTDAGADINIEYISQNDVKVISMRYILNDKEYVFGNGEAGPTLREVFDELRKGGSAKTQLINQEEHIEHFEPYLKDGKSIIHIPLSSGLSGTCDCAKRAANELNEKYKDSRVVVFDFKGASMGQALFVDYLVKMRDQGKSLDEAIAFCNENALKMCHYFTVDDLKHLRRGGRISGFSSFVGTILNIKPLLHVDNEGKLIPIKKTISRSKALNSLIEKMKELVEDFNQRIYICHADSEDDAKIVAQKITTEFGITDITIGSIGPIVGLHSGPGTIALFFLGKHR